MNSSFIVSKVWNKTHILKNAGVGYGDYVENLQIVAEVEARTTAIDHLEAELDSQNTCASQLRRGILDSAFSGEGAFV